VIKNPRAIVHRALVTEKGTKRRESANQYFFEVAPDANKIEIKEAVQRIFNVKVEQVRTMWMPPKSKRMGRYAGKTAAWKRAVVTLEADQNIELFEEI
jgi:large subunit ribosomal protein L23